MSMHHITSKDDLPTDLAAPDDGVQYQYGDEIWTWHADDAPNGAYHLTYTDDYNQRLRQRLGW